MDAPFPDGMVECIKEFFEKDHAPPGLDTYPKVFSSPLFFPLQRQAELREMMRIARRINPRVVMEIGSDKGGGLYHWCKSLPSVQRVIACEIRGTPYRKLFEKAFPTIDFLWIEGSSYDPETIKRVDYWLSCDAIDCLFIDGDKSKFYADFEAYLPIMNGVSGIVFMHDINDSIPKAAFDSVAKKYKTNKIIDVSDSRYVLARQNVGLPPENTHEEWLRHWAGESCGVGVIYIGEPK